MGSDTTPPPPIPRFPGRITSSHRTTIAGYLACGILLLLGLTIVPTVFVGLYRPLSTQYVDLIKWLVTVEVAALGPAFGFFFSEQLEKSR